MPSAFAMPGLPGALINLPERQLFASRKDDDSSMKDSFELG